MPKPSSAQSATRTRTLAKGAPLPAQTSLAKMKTFASRKGRFLAAIRKAAH